MNLTEGKAVLNVPAGAPRKNGEAFYNPDAVVSRDIGVAVISSLGRKNLRMADVLSGTGARTVRLLKESPKNTIKEVFINDINPKAISLIKKNIKTNKLSKVKVSNNEATLFLMGLNMVDYIDIDPFGSPVPFLDTAMRRLANNGILAIAATDTAALTGSSFSACVRKYNARPMHGEMMHEIGMRILIKKVQEIGAQHERALTPIYCHSTKHYMRAYFKCEAGAEKAKDVLHHHGFIHFCPRCLNRFVSKFNAPKPCCDISTEVAGPLWLGRLCDEKLAEKVNKFCEVYPETKKITSLISDESLINSAFTFSLPKISSVLSKNAPKQKDLLENLKKKGYSVSLSHFGRECVRTNAPLEEVKKLFT
jgi:tRNA (guanine26-N2/guanine27-N2)-dimethyltransferase